MHSFFLDAIEEIYKMLLFQSIQNKYLFTLYVVYSQNWGPHDNLTQANDEVAAHASLGLAGATSYSLLEGH